MKRKVITILYIIYNMFIVGSIIDVIYTLDNSVFKFCTVCYFVYKGIIEMIINYIRLWRLGRYSDKFNNKDDEYQEAKEPNFFDILVCFVINVMMYWYADKSYAHFFALGFVLQKKLLKYEMIDLYLKKQNNQ